jgi:hypothetical protein
MKCNSHEVARKVAETGKNIVDKIATTFDWLFWWLEFSCKDGMTS